MKIEVLEVKLNQLIYELQNLVREIQMSDDRRKKMVDEALKKRGAIDELKLIITEQGSSERSQKTPEEPKMVD